MWWPVPENKDIYFWGACITKNHSSKQAITLSTSNFLCCIFIVSALLYFQEFSEYFSVIWYFYLYISNHENFNFAETVLECVMRVSGIMENTPIGKVLQKHEVNIMDCVKAYLSDFVHMVYHVTSVKEHEVK